MKRYAWLIPSFIFLIGAAHAAVYNQLIGVSGSTTQRFHVYQQSGCIFTNIGGLYYMINTNSAGGGGGAGGGTTNILVVGSTAVTNDTQTLAVSGLISITLTTNTSGALVSFSLSSDILTNHDARLGTMAWSETNSFATSAQGSHADTAFGWGNHASAGYLTFVDWPANPSNSVLTALIDAKVNTNDLGTAAYSNTNQFLGATAQAADSAKLGGVSVSGLVQTSRTVTVILNGASNTVNMAANGVIDLGTVATVTGSVANASNAGSLNNVPGSAYLTNQQPDVVFGPGSTIPYAAGSGTSAASSNLIVATAGIALNFADFQNITTNDFLGGIIRGNDSLTSRSGNSNLVFCTVANSSTLAFNGLATATFIWPIVGDAATLTLSFRKTITTNTDFVITLGKLNGTTSKTLTAVAAAADTTYTTNFAIGGSIFTNAVQGDWYYVNWWPTFSSTNNAANPAYMGICPNAYLLK